MQVFVYSDALCSFGLFDVCGVTANAKSVFAEALSSSSSAVGRSRHGR